MPYTEKLFFNVDNTLKAFLPIEPVDPSILIDFKTKTIDKRLVAL